MAAGRNEQVLRTLNDLGADATIHLNQPDKELTKAFIREVSHKPFDVIIDYLWGHPTEVLLDALIGHDLKAGASRIRLVEIGEMAGPTIALSAAALRSSGLELYGSGGGAFRTQPSSTPSRRSGRWPPEANSASIPSKLRSPTWKSLGNGKTYLVADSSLSRKQLPSGKNVFL